MNSDAVKDGKDVKEFIDFSEKVSKAIKAAYNPKAGIGREINLELAYPILNHKLKKERLFRTFRNWVSPYPTLPATRVKLDYPYGVHWVVSEYKQKNKSWHYLSSNISASIPSGYKRNIFCSKKMFLDFVHNYLNPQQFDLLKIELLGIENSFELLPPIKDVKNKVLDQINSKLDALYNAVMAKPQGVLTTISGDFSTKTTVSKENWTYPIDVAAKTLNVTPNQLRAYMRVKRLVTVRYKDHETPTQEMIERGYMIAAASGNQGRVIALLTNKGLDYLSNRISNDLQIKDPQAELIFKKPTE